MFLIHLLSGFKIVEQKETRKTCLEQAANTLTRQNHPQISQILSLSATIGREIHASLSLLQQQGLSTMHC